MVFKVFICVFMYGSIVLECTLMLFLMFNFKSCKKDDIKQPIIVKRTLTSKYEIQFHFL
jgi:hypothetical protein